MFAFVVLVITLQKTDLKKNKIKCANCYYGNKKYNLTRNTEHIATDTEKCEYLKHIINKTIRSTAIQLHQISWDLMEIFLTN